MTKRTFVVVGFSLLMMLAGCAATTKGGLPDHIDFDNVESAEVAMHAQEFRTMDSLSEIGWMLAGQDGVAWIASDSLMADLPKDKRVGYSGWVAQGNLRDGFCIFYGKDSSGLFQIARYDFSSGHMSRSVARTELPEGKIYNLVQKNESAYNFFENSGEAYKIPYNTYILENEGQYTFYVIPGSTSEYAIFGGAFKLTSVDTTWQMEKLHKSPTIMKWAAIKGNKLVRTSSMGDLLNEADFAQYYIYEKSLPEQYIKTQKYLIALLHDEKGKMTIMVVK